MLSISTVAKIGWANHLFLSTEGRLAEDGVGDDSQSWAYDGMRGKKWNGEDHDYGTDVVAGREDKGSSSGSKGKTVKAPVQGSAETDADLTSAGAEVEKSSWKVGDIVGCLLDLTAPPGSDGPRGRMSFTLNGVNLGVAYDDVSLSSTSSASSSKSSGDGKVGYFYPAMSLEDGEAVLLNIGQRPFSHPPPADTNEVRVAVAASVQEQIETIAESDPGSNSKKAPAVKRGRKSKKDLALEKELKEKEQADADADSLKKSLAAVSVPIAVAPSPFLPVYEAIENSIRELIPTDSRPDSSGTGV